MRNKRIAKRVADSRVYIGVGFKLNEEYLSLPKCKDRLRSEMTYAESCRIVNPYVLEKIDGIKAARSMIEDINGECGCIPFGYDIGVRPPYGGLPIDIFSYLDPALQEIVDKLANTPEVALTGFCCSGHVVKRHTKDHRILTYPTESPHLTLLLDRRNYREECKRLVRALSRVEVRVSKPWGSISLSNRLESNVKKFVFNNYVNQSYFSQLKTMIQFAVMGIKVVTIRIKIKYKQGKVKTSAREMEEALKKLLASFWNKVADEISPLLPIGIKHEIKPEFIGSQFICDIHGTRRNEYYVGTQACNML